MEEAAVETVADATPVRTIDKMTPKQILDKVFALATFAKHRATKRVRPSKHAYARMQRAQARIKHRKGLR